MKSMVMRNPLVIMIPIGEYDKRLGYIDLPVKNDMLNVMKLFGEQLGYDVYPQYNRTDLKKQNGNVKLHWTKNEVINLLTDRAQFLRQNLDVHDGLVLMMSCHGMNGSIISSDGHQIPKLFIHRIFSMDGNMAGVRNIPRLFVFDCCDGDFDQKKCEREMKDEADIIGAMELETAKSSSLTTVTWVSPQWRKDSIPWAKNEHNPDYKLAVVHAANENFSSICRGDIGSYLIYLLVAKLSRNSKRWTICRGRRYLGEILSEIQTLLEMKGKQMIVPVCQSGTERIVFEKNREPLDFAESREPLLRSVAEPNGPVLEMTKSQTSVSEDKVLTAGSPTAQSPSFAADLDMHQNEDGQQITENANPGHELVTSTSVCTLFICVSYDLSKSDRSPRHFNDLFVQTVIGIKKQDLDSELDKIMDND